MAKKKISGLPAGSALNGTELVPIVQTGTTKRITTQDIANLGNSSGVEGSGTINTLAKFTASSTIGNTNLINDASGQLGFGVTPSPWSSSLVRAFQIGNLGGSISSFTALNTSNPWMFMDNNAYNDGTNDKYIISKAAARYVQVLNEHRWLIAPSGTAGGNITFTQAMTLDASGNLGLGKTAPLGILHLYKAAAATRVVIDGDAAQSRIITYRTGGVQRFGLYVNNTAESGANAGSDFAIRAYNDAGTLLSTPLFIKRSTGNVLINTTTDSTFKLDVNGTARVSGAATFGSTGTFSAGIVATRLDINAPTNGNQVNLLSNGISSGQNIAYGVGKSITSGNSAFFGWVSSGASSGYAFIESFASASNLVLNTGGAGNVLINTTTDAGFKLDVNGTARVVGAATFGSGIALSNGTAPASGIQFPATQVASANNNNLDDYEEGTCTLGVSFGGGTTGITYSATLGQYTKIGRQVTVTGYLLLTNKGSSTGTAVITGLPFTVGNLSSFLAASSIYFGNITFLGTYSGFAVNNTTTISLNQVTTLGVSSNITDANFANNSGVIISLTYFV